MKPAFQLPGFYAIVLPKVEGRTFHYDGLNQAETRNNYMSWNPNQGQDPNQPSQYGAYTPPPSQPQPTDPYSGPQGGYGQQGSYGQQPGGQQYQQPGYQQPGPGGYQQGPYGAPPSGAQSPLGPTSMGMQPNVEAGLSYVLTWVTGLIFFLMEKQNRFVRFHAMQSILFFGGLTVINIILSVIGGFGVVGLGLITGLLSGAVGIVGLVGYIVLLINGFQGKYFKLPIVGDYAEKYANQGAPGM